MTWLTRIALNKPWLTYLVTALVAGAAGWGTITLKTELIPDIELPMTTIVTIYPQASSEAVMNEVSIPIENAIADLKGLKHITSTSQENTSLIFAEFVYGTDMTKANSEITARISGITFPAAVESALNLMPELGTNPKIVPINMNLLPVVTCNLAGDADLSELKQIAEDQVKPELALVEGVYNVTVTGGEGNKIIVTPRLETMNQLGISTGQLAGFLSTQTFTSVEAVGNAMLTPLGPQIKQIATVEYGAEPGAVIERTNGKPSIRISIDKTADANTVNTANAIVKKINEINAGLPAGVQIYVALDQSTYVESSIADLANNAYLGGGLAVLVVFIFLMAFGASLITAVSVPLSVLLAFLVMRLTNVSLNILTLAAMIMAIGQVIDNAIVVLEVTYRRLQAGEKFPQAAINGVKEVIVPITATTVATVVIFVPLIFIGGIIGELFIPFALTITYAMLGSLLIALTVVPALARLLKVKITQQHKEEHAPKYQKIYVSWLKWCLAHRKLTISMAVVIFLGSLGLIPVVGTSYMPDLNINVVAVEITLPDTATQSELLDTTTRVENILGSNKNVQNYFSSIGSTYSNSSGFLAMLGGGSSHSNVAYVMAILAPDTKAVKVAAELQTSCAAVPTSGEIKVNTLQAMSSGSTSFSEVSIRGNILGDIASVTQTLSARLQTLSGLGEQTVNANTEEAHLSIEPDAAKLVAAGFNELQVNRLQQEFLLLKNGGTVGSASLNGTSTEVIIPAVLSKTTGLNTINELKVGLEKTVALKDIATISVSVKPTSISRTDQKLSASILVAITDENVGAVNAAIQDEIDGLALPPGVEITTGGVIEDMTESFKSMFYAIILSVVLVFVVLLITYRSLKNTLIILLSLPLSTIGAFVALLISGNTLGVTGLMGLLQLVGIVLANAVLLIAYVTQLRKEGATVYDALIEGARTRLRPILMTALTTLIAILPMAFGFGSSGVIMATEMAVVVVGGLFSSTCLTLLIVPVVYSMVYDKAAKKVK